MRFIFGDNLSDDCGGHGDLEATLSYKERQMHGIQKQFNESKLQIRNYNFFQMRM
jgi:hypothetical protein